MAVLLFLLLLLLLLLLLVLLLLLLLLLTLKCLLSIHLLPSAQSHTIYMYTVQ